MKPIPPHTATSKTLINALRRSTTEQEFIKAARLIWREHHPVTTSKGGRPSRKDKIWTACDQVWRAWAGRFPRGQSTVNALVQAVSEWVPGKRTADRKRGIEPHVKAWMRRSLNNRDLPDHFLRQSKEGMELVRMSCEMSLFIDNIKKTLPGGFTLNNPSDRLALEKAYKKSREQISAIPIKELVRKAITARKSSPSDTVLFSWIKTSHR